MQIPVQTMSIIGSIGVARDWLPLLIAGLSAFGALASALLFLILTRRLIKLQKEFQKWRAAPYHREIVSTLSHATLFEKEKQIDLELSLYNPKPEAAILQNMGVVVPVHIGELVIQAKFPIAAIELEPRLIAAEAQLRLQETCPLDLPIADADGKEVGLLLSNLVGVDIHCEFRVGDRSETVILSGVELAHEKERTVRAMIVDCW